MLSQIRMSEMKANGGKLILLYRQSDLDQHLNKSVMIQIVNSLNVAQHISETALVKSSGVEGIEDGDEVIVQYIVGWDTDYDAMGKIVRNQFFISKDDDGEWRWCFADQVFGLRRNGKITPTKNYVLCELPPKPQEYKGLIHIPEIYQKQDTDNKAFKAKLKYIREEDAEELDLQSGDMVWCAKNTDAVKKVFGEELIRVPIEKLLGKDSE